MCRPFDSGRGTQGEPIPVGTWYPDRVCFQSTRVPLCAQPETWGHGTSGRTVGGPGRGGKGSTPNLLRSLGPGRSRLPGPDVSGGEGAPTSVSCRDPGTTVEGTGTETVVQVLRRGSAGVWAEVRGEAGVTWTAAVWATSSTFRGITFWWKRCAL